MDFGFRHREFAWQRLGIYTKALPVEGLSVAV